jgi:hypothetical protein
VSDKCDIGHRLCEVRLYPSPSGRMRMRHDDKCPDKPGEPINVREYAKGRQWHPAGGKR